MTAPLKSAAILGGWRNDRDNLTVNDYKLIKADLEDFEATGDGDVVGPASSIDQEITVMDGTTGKLIAGSGVTISQLLANIFSGALQVDAATTAPLTGTWTYNNLGGVGDTLTKTTNGAFQTVDTVVSAVNKTYLLKNEANQLTNGKWQLTTQGTAGTASVLTRSTDSDTAVEFDAQVILVGGGSLAGNLRKVFSQTTPLPTPGTNNIVYGSSSAAGLGIPLTRTVAQMQALIAGAGLTRGRGYFITGMAAAQFVTCSAYFVATSTTTISSMGWCPAFENLVSTAAVEMEVEYTITTDEITELYCPASRNRMGANAVDTAGLYNFPFDSATIYDNNMRSISSCTIDPAANLTRSTLSAGASITMSSGSTFQGFCAPGGGISLAGTATYTGTIGAEAALTMLGTQHLTNCTIGDGKTADLTGVATTYTAVGKVYIGDVSTFEITGTDSAAVNPDVTNTIDMATFPWAGILICDDASFSIDIVSNFSTDHKYKIYSATAIVMTVNYRNNGGTGGTIRANTLLTINASDTITDGDVMELEVYRKTPTDLIAINYYVN